MKKKSMHVSASTNSVRILTDPSCATAEGSLIGRLHRWWGLLASFDESNSQASPRPPFVLASGAWAQSCPRFLLLIISRMYQSSASKNASYDPGSCSNGPPSLSASSLIKVIRSRRRLSRRRCSSSSSSSSCHHPDPPPLSLPLNSVTARDG